MGKRIMALICAVVLSFSCTACSLENKAVINAEQLIDAIGEVTLEAKTAIEAAQSAYHALSKEDREKVQNYQELISAIREFGILEAVKNVEDLIDAIGTVTLESGTAINQAKNAYNALKTDIRFANLGYDLRTKVSNASVLQKADEKYQELQELAEAQRKKEEEAAEAQRKKEEEAELIYTNAALILINWAQYLYRPSSVDIHNVWHYQEGDKHWYTFDISVDSKAGITSRKYYGNTESGGFSFKDDDFSSSLGYLHVMLSLGDDGGPVFKKGETFAKKNGTKLDASRIQRLYDANI